MPPGLPDDNHVHTQWSWDAPRGDMEATCARAVQLGVRSVTFTEHVDLTPWAVHDGQTWPGDRAEVVDGWLVPERLDVAGYFECLQRCRARFGELRILSGVEFSEPHLHPDALAALTAGGRFDRVLGSVHSLVDLHPPAGTGAGPGAGVGRVEVRDAYRQRGALEVVRGYVEEVAAMVAADAPFAVLAHIDYPLRSWPPSEPFRLELIEDQLREVLTALAATGRALEVNTRLPLAAEVVEWWHQAGGQAVTFGSDAHQPDRVAWQFADTAAMVAAHGFRPGDTPYELWRRI